MKSFEPTAYALLRIIAGFMFLCHGTEKLFDWPTPGPDPLGTQMLIAGIIELVCGLLITFGLFTRWAAFLASGLMAVAYWTGHGLKDGKPLPIQNQGELAVLFCFVFLFIFAHGSGRLSLDRAQQNRRRD